MISYSCEANLLDGNKLKYSTNLVLFKQFIDKYGSRNRSVAETWMVYYLF